ncbi:MAG TPA: D-2-hydroxyacid dehydrogenase [Candidatus Acidoferrales bacterium]|nr:D-2-hydroxyacid dehydrogenase [Candidatus Acidoferrales bacterium]
MRIVVLDGHTLNPGDNPWDELARLGTLEVHARSLREEIVTRACEAEIVLTNKTRLPADILESLPRLRFIAVLATGYDVVDIAAARTRRIPVSNVPEYGTDSVAQHVFALLLELCHRTGDHDGAVHAGEWTASPDFSFWRQSPIELAGLTLGIVGLGRIGRRVASLAQCFGMKVIRAARTDTAKSDSPIAVVPLAELFATADVVTLHCPLVSDNARCVNAGLLQRMKPTAFLINTARGALIEEGDLAAALNQGLLAGAALDVLSNEPMSKDNPLATARNCIITPHIAWASLAARRRLMAATVQNVRAFIDGRPINVVNGI